jgi:uncharacterized Zn-binding protein involved in type VI secretion
MIGVARHGDRAEGICHRHNGDLHTTGYIVASGNLLDIEGLGIARVGDVVQFDCGHTGVIVTGSDCLIVSGIQAARIGDQVAGDVDGVIVSGSLNIETR